jgi:hypothetical protein
MKRNFTQKWCLLALLVCMSGAAAHAQARSYYVRANGDDNNNGRSEDAPLKTLEKAAAMAKMGVIKTITVIGPIGEGAKISDTGSDEILITGKQNAGDAEKAVIKGGVRLDDTKVRFTHIRLESELSANGTVTLGEGVVVTGGISNRGTLTMTGNAQITGGTGESGINNGEYYRGGGATIMSGNARITGCSVGVKGGTLTMSDNAEISGNKGMGVTAGTVTLSGNAKISGNEGVGVYAGIVTLSDNAEISGNKGGGVSLVSYWGYRDRAKLTISGNASITGNTAKKGGGVVYVIESGGQGGDIVMEGGTISGNKAEYGAGVYVLKGCSFTQKGGTITGNEAEFVGGGVYAESGGTYTAQGGTVTGNKAGDGGENVFRQQ